MNEPIRLLHFSDVHIGVENYGKTDPDTGISSRVVDFLRRLSEVVEYAEANDADIAVFAGDAFKTSSPNPTYQREFARRIKRLARQCPVVLLVGNHDVPAITQRASSIEIFHTLEVDNVIVGRTDKLHYIETKRGPVQVATVPYPVRQRLLGDMVTYGMSLGEVDDLLRQQVDLVIRSLTEQLDPHIPAVLVGHFGVQGARLGSEQNIMLGRDVAVLRGTLADPAWDYVALGHVHSHQDLNAGYHPPVVYSGGIERVDFGEEGEPKGFCWVNLARGQTTYQFVELNARPFVTIRVDVRGFPDPMRAIINEVNRYDVEGAVVRVIITALPENEPLIRDRDIETALGKAAYIAAIIHEIDRQERRRLGTAHAEELTPVELLERYLIAKGVSPDRIAVLKEYAEKLFAEIGGFETTPPPSEAP